MQDIEANALVNQIKQDMRLAFKNGNQLERITLQTLLARISNAEAVLAPQKTEIHVGVGSTEMGRKELSLTEVVKVIHDEAQEIESALNSVDKTSNYTQELHHKLAIVQRYTNRAKIN